MGMVYCVEAKSQAVTLPLDLEIDNINDLITVAAQYPDA